MNQMQDKVRAGYNQVAHAYSDSRDQFKNEKYLLKLQEMLNSNSTILDLGCGSGKPVAAFLVKHGHKVIGIDISDEQIRLAKENVADGKFEVRDMSTLTDGEYQVDAIVSFYTIFHIPKEEHQQLFARLNSFLRKDGLILVTMGSSEWEGSEEFFGAEMLWSHYDHPKNTQIVTNAGFELLIDEIDDTGGEKHQVILGRKI
jgi:cyclopropane fatty-acyl-phospholipid synthase-like methyltransferase